MGTVKSILNSIWVLSLQKIWHSITRRQLYGIRMKEIKRITEMQPKKKGIVNFKGKQLEIVDSASFLYMHREIFGAEIYKFTADTEIPFIIDGGANIGLSIIYFKSLYPNAQLIAFEPDEEVFDALKRNIETFGLKDIELIPKGLAAEEGTSSFLPDNSDGGHFITNPIQGSRFYPTTTLAEYINKPIDFLKLDIEGSEIDVIPNIEKKLHLVKNVFVEYHSFKENIQSLDLILKILTESGFRYYIQSIYSVKSPFMKVTNNMAMDMQLNISAFRQ